MNMRKKISMGIAGLALSIAITIPAFAGTWQKLDGGESWQWKYVEEDGSYTTNNWQLINNIWYHFDSDGYLDVGMREIDGQTYILMESGALETNRDYGYASSDANGVWTVKPYDFEADINVAADCCRQYGIDIDTILSELGSKNVYTYSCSTEKFPTDSEGGPLNQVAGDAILSAINFHVLSMGAYCTAYNYSWAVENGTFTITFTNLEDSINNIINY